MVRAKKLFSLTIILGSEVSVLVRMVNLLLHLILWVWVKLWKVEDGTVKDDTPLKTISAHPRRWVTYVKFSPDSKIIASASADTTVKLWKVEDGSLLKTLKGHKNLVRGVDFSPDGKKPCFHQCRRREAVEYRGW
jgi:WD40 repeat protein